MTTPHDMTDHEPQTEPTVDPQDSAVAEMEADSSGAEAVEESIESATEPRPRLIVKRQGVETGEEFPIAAPATIGRFDPSVGPIDVDLGNIEEGGYVSRKHAKITEDAGVFSIQDLGSSNGVYILRDGEFQRVAESELADGDEIAFGNARFVFRVS
ncbi:MAG: FHA domain-containing protein [Armatimonadetes bacterium]|nr:FHA domain-containing protein [Armatimonadota bacterium]MBS1710896.1 FHA domain-containing protein [Armatimonadota bacterium]MBX3108568.1 FHA domain-containing protein [Fimbriimonadaceae bacterium]